MKIFNLSKTYKLSKNQTAPALKGISFELPERGMVFILGRSGSGKSTLLNILSGLDGFDGGDSLQHAGLTHVVCAIYARRFENVKLPLRADVGIEFFYRLIGNERHAGLLAENEKIVYAYA